MEWLAHRSSRCVPAVSTPLLSATRGPSFFSSYLFVGTATSVPAPLFKQWTYRAAVCEVIDSHIHSEVHFSGGEGDAYSGRPLRLSVLQRCTNAPRYLEVQERSAIVLNCVKKCPPQPAGFK